jgi:glutamate--cysteine ligase
MKTTLIENESQLVNHLEAGSKPPEQWRIGTEYEKFGFLMKDLSPLTYDGSPGIRQILEELSSKYSWEPVRENGNVIALQGNGGSITLEPGGQLELSGAALTNLHETCDEVHTHLDQVKSVAQPLGVGFLGMGFTPLYSRDEIPWMPKDRYRIMRKYMPQVGTLGLDMMLRTATVQVNLDYRDEADMIKKFRVSLALQPLATALFANSPFTEGQPNGYLSYRSRIWRDTDAARCGMLPFVFEEGMGFERYVQYALDVPMYFVHRRDHYIDAAGQSFRDFLVGKLPALPGELPTISDWENHLTTIFPEVRMKQYLEMRGADAGAWNGLCGLPAFWVGLLYDNDSLDETWDLVTGWTNEEREQVRNDTPRLGLKTTTPAGTLQNLAKKVLDISERGLKRRAQLNHSGNDETGFLCNLKEIAESGQTPAEQKLDRFHNNWKRNIKAIFTEFAY